MVNTSVATFFLSGRPLRMEPEPANRNCLEPNPFFVCAIKYLQRCAFPAAVYDVPQESHALALPYVPYAPAVFENLQD